MAFLADAFREVGGFDEAYGGVGDWSEPDICYRIRKAGYTLWFNPKAALYHEPSRTGAFKKRKKVGARLTNYFLFARRWVKPHWKHTAYKLFLRAYFSIKELGIA